jgi:NAD(P)-dependent dehydrogenase (short-subunit alcohol dehydrogenase family)
MTKVLLVTGGSAGIGAATVRLAAARGYKVAFSYRSSDAAAHALVDEVTKAGGIARAFKSDAADEAATIALFNDVDKAFGRLDALVTNAGITGPTASLETITSATLDEVFALNVRGVFIATREAIKRMATDLGGKGGSIVNLSSVAAALGGPNVWVHYAASKGAIDSFTIGAAKELAPRGIRVNAVVPGLINTEIHAKAGMGDRLAQLGSSVPMGRVGTAEEVAKSILFLLSDQASYTTGTFLTVAGGR